MKLIKLFGLVFVMGILSGCAGIESTIKPDKIQAVKIIAVIAEPTHEDPRILDHTKLSESRSASTGALFGLAGALVESAIISAESNSAISKSLGGDSKMFQELFKGYKINDVLNASLKEKLSTGFSVVDVTALRDKCSKEPKESCSVDEYLKSAKENLADALVLMKYDFGVAGYKDQPASVSIDGNIMVYDVQTSKMIMRKQLTSDQIYNSPHTISDYVKNEGEIFKSEISKAASAQSMLVANEWGLFDEEVLNAKKTGANTDFFDRQGIPSEVMSMVKVDCNKPAKLDQDCSGAWGATKRIKIEKIKVSIAGSHDGSTVMVMYGEPLKALPFIKETADRHNIKINKATKFGLGGKVEGFILEASGDLYSALKEYSY